MRTICKIQNKESLDPYAATNKTCSICHEWMHFSAGEIIYNECEKCAKKLKSTNKGLYARHNPRTF